MSNIAKLKKQATDFELKKQFDKALEVWVKLLANFDQNADELDVALFNRVGDLYLRQGNVSDALDYYERAVDKYADGGFFNNAIALCSKILRQSPGRVSVYYKLGKISAKKGFKADAKQNFLEYAERMQKAGNTDEAFRALAEFADLCPDQDDIRLMLAEQLQRAGRQADAIEQLQTLYERYDSEGRVAEASATADRMRAIDPSVEPRSSGGGVRKAASDDLIFIDLDDTPKPPRRSMESPVVSVPPPTPKPAPPPPPPAPPPPPPQPVAPPPSMAPPPAARQTAPATETPVEATMIDLATPPSTRAVDSPIEVTRISDLTEGIDATSTPAGGMLGLEATSLSDSIPAVPPPTQSLDLEPTSLAEDAPIERASFGMPSVEEPPPAVEPAKQQEPEPEPEPEPEAEPEPEPVDIGDDLSFAMPTPTPSTSAPAARPTPEFTDSVGDDLDFIMPPGTPLSTPAVSPTPAASSPGIVDLDVGLDEPEESVATPEPIARQSAPSAVPDMPVLDEPIVVPEAARASAAMPVKTVALLQAQVDADPENWSLVRELAEAMLEEGDRTGGIARLEQAMGGAEGGNDLVLAGSLADELSRLEPDAPKHHQKRVEYAFRRNDRPRLIEAYLGLGDSLLRADQAEKARTVYQRVLDLSPDDIRARAALDSIPDPEPETPPPPPRASGRMSTMKQTKPTTPQSTPAPAAAPADDFVNLGDWLREDDEPKDTRMVVEEQEPTGDEDADFADMLAKFKQGVAQNVDAEDYQSHYDLAIAFKEMGLIDEAISEFQKALAGPSNRLPTYESLGLCFLEKEQYRMASSILQRALAEPNVTEAQLVGVLYLLGRAAEAQGKNDDAVDYYQRVFVVDIQFKDVADRLSALGR